MHAVVMGSHAPTRETSTGRVLWRLDQAGSHDLQLFVVSRDRPDFTGLVEQAGWPTTSTWDTTSYQPFLQRLDAGQRWRFRLTANPVRAVSRHVTDTGRGQIAPHKTKDHQQRWFLDRVEGWGFGIPFNSVGAAQVAVVSAAATDFRRRDDDAQEGRVTITRATYEGVLEVVDSKKLTEALTHGMGRAKAYGCGLMTLAPVG